jgi:hypothetical protein
VSEEDRFEPTDGMERRQEVVANLLGIDDGILCEWKFHRNAIEVWLTDLGFSSEQPRSTTQRAAHLAARVRLDESSGNADLRRDAHRGYSSDAKDGMRWR